LLNAKNLRHWDFLIDLTIAFVPKINKLIKLSSFISKSWNVSTLVDATLISYRETESACRRVGMLSVSRMEMYRIVKTVVHSLRQLNPPWLSISLPRAATWKRSPSRRFALRVRPTDFSKARQSKFHSIERADTFKMLDL